MSLHIRPAALADAAAIAPLFDAYRQFYEQPADLPMALHFVAQRLERSESVILLVLDECDMAVGFCQLYPSFCSVEAAPIYVLYDLYVSPSARGQGAGRYLLLAAEDHARRQGRVRMDLTTAHTNHLAQSLYESMGWELDTVFRAYTRRVG